MYANKRRVAGKRGKQLLRRRGEFLERPFAHQYETGGLRRVHVRGRGNVAKRVLVQAAAFNLALILRSITKAGTPRGLADLKNKLFYALFRVLAALAQRYAPKMPSLSVSWVKFHRLARRPSRSSKFAQAKNRGSDTGC